jgi:hypothetical protein
MRIPAPALLVASRRRTGLKNSVFRSLVDLPGCGQRFLGETNQSPKPFVWIAGSDEIIAAVRRGYHALDSIR